jgi:hypothetical protein
VVVIGSGPPEHTLIYVAVTVALGCALIVTTCVDEVLFILHPCPE